MAGVAGPRLRAERREAVRLLAGLVLGRLAGGVVLAVPAYLLARATHAALDTSTRLWLAAGACVVFAVFDLADRTPHPWRQVPQTLVHRLPPGALGVAWGVDLGLLFTTQKVASLIWVSLAGSVLLDPATAAAVPVVAAGLAGLGEVALSVAGPRWYGARSRLARLPRRHVRWASGLVLLAVFAATAAQAWQQ
jgi:hypothetical protein